MSGYNFLFPRRKKVDDKKTEDKDNNIEEEISPKDLSWIIQDEQTSNHLLNAKKETPKDIKSEKKSLKPGKESQKSSGSKRKDVKNTMPGLSADFFSSFSMLKIAKYLQGIDKEFTFYTKGQYKCLEPQKINNISCNMLYLSGEMHIPINSLEALIVEFTDQKEYKTALKSLNEIFLYPKSYLAGRKMPENLRYDDLIPNTENELFPESCGEKLRYYLEKQRILNKQIKLIKTKYHDYSHTEAYLISAFGLSLVILTENDSKLIILNLDEVVFLKFI
ncbi:MAG: hypothetical protein FWE36_08655 [Erysipelotrichales bacterium]|nr:hypothetical protein [Erysipelotrichales bacterium]